MKGCASVADFGQSQCACERELCAVVAELLGILESTAASTESSLLVLVQEYKMVRADSSTGAWLACHVCLLVVGHIHNGVTHLPTAQTATELTALWPIAILTLVDPDSKLQGNMSGWCGEMRRSRHAKIWESVSNGGVIILQHAASNSCIGGLVKRLAKGMSTTGVLRTVSQGHVTYDGLLQILI